MGTVKDSIIGAIAGGLITGFLTYIFNQNLNAQQYEDYKNVQGEYKNLQNETIKLKDAISTLERDKYALSIAYNNLQEKCTSSLNTQKNQEIVIAPSIQDSAGAKASRYDSSVYVLESCQIQSGGDVEIMKHPFSMGGKEYKNMVLMKTNGMVSFPTKYKFNYFFRSHFFKTDQSGNSA